MQIDRKRISAILNQPGLDKDSALNQLEDLIESERGRATIWIVRHMADQGLDPVRTKPLDMHQAYENFLRK